MLPIEVWVKFCPGYCYRYMIYFIGTKPNDKVRSNKQLLPQTYIHINENEIVNLDF